MQSTDETAGPVIESVDPVLPLEGDNKVPDEYVTYVDSADVTETRGTEEFPDGEELVPAQAELEVSPVPEDEFALVMDELADRLANISLEEVSHEAAGQLVADRAEMDLEPISTDVTMDDAPLFVPAAVTDDCMDIDQEAAETQIDVDMMAVDEPSVPVDAGMPLDVLMAEIDGHVPNPAVVEAMSTQEVEMTGGDEQRFLPALPVKPTVLTLEVEDWEKDQLAEGMTFTELLERDDDDLSDGPVETQVGDGVVFDPLPVQQQEQQQQQQLSPPLSPEQTQQQLSVEQEPDILAPPQDLSSQGLPTTPQHNAGMGAEELALLQLQLEMELLESAPPNESSTLPEVDPAAPDSHSLVQQGQQAEDAVMPGEDRGAQGTTPSHEFSFALTGREAAFGRQILSPSSQRPAEGLVESAPQPVPWIAIPVSTEVMDGTNEWFGGETALSDENDENAQSSEQIAARHILPMPRRRTQAQAQGVVVPPSIPTSSVVNQPTTDANLVDQAAMPIDPALFAEQDQGLPEGPTPHEEEEVDLYGDDSGDAEPSGEDSASGQTVEQPVVAAPAPPPPSVQYIGGMAFPGGNPIQTGAPAQVAETPQQPVAAIQNQGEEQRSPSGPHRPQADGETATSSSPATPSRVLPTRRTPAKKPSLFMTPRRPAPQGRPSVTPRTADGGSADRERAARSSEAVETNLRRAEEQLPPVVEQQPPSRSGITIISQRQAAQIFNDQERAREAAGGQEDEA